MASPAMGIIHVHSTFSRDGLCSIADLAEFARKVGFQFVALTDHAEDLSAEDLGRFPQLCRRHSDESMVMLPGLEFRCRNDIHLLGIGIACPIQSSDPVTVATHIRAEGGLAILAHPSRSDYRCPPELWAVLNGIEVWNVGYDGRFVPPMPGFRILQEARRANPSVFGFGGADSHGLHRPPGVMLQLRGNGELGGDATMILRHLKSGQFIVRGKYVAFDAVAAPNPLRRSSLWAFRKLYEMSKAIRDIGILGTRRYP